jgi:hypothetical protein
VASKGWTDEFAKFSAAIDNLNVALASAAGTTKAVLAQLDDWDPLEHPRDVWGMFVKKGTGTYLYGKAKKATFTTKTGKPQTHSLQPGDSLWKTTAGNHVVIHPDNSVTFISASKGGIKMPEGSAKAAEWVAMSKTKIGSGLTLVDYAPAVEVKATNEMDAQTALDAKASLLAESMADPSAWTPGGSGTLAEGATAYKADDGHTPGYIIKHKGKVYYYATTGTSTAQAVELAPQDVPAALQKFTQVVNASYNPGKAEKIKADLAEAPLKDWEKELMQGAETDGAAAGAADALEPKPALPDHTVMFHGTLFQATSKFYEHNKTANSYLVIEPNGTPWKIDKTGKMISGVQAVKYLHNYHDITDKIVKANKDVGPEFVQKVAAGEFTDNAALMADQTKKLDVLTQLPDGVEIADGGPGHSVAVKSGGLYALYDGKGQHIGSGETAKASYDAFVEDGGKTYIKGGVEKPAPPSPFDKAWEWDEAKQKWKPKPLPPVADAVKTDAEKKQATLDALPPGTLVVDAGPNFGFAVKTKTGTTVAYNNKGEEAPYTESHYAVFQTMFDQAKESGYKVYTTGDPAVIAKIKAPFESDVEVHPVATPDGFFYIANIEAGAASSYLVAYDQNGKPASEFAKAELVGMWEQATGEKVGSTAHVVKPGAEVPKVAPPGYDMPSATDYKSEETQTLWREYAETVRKTFPKDAPSAELVYDGSEITHYMVLDTGGDHMIVLRKHENGLASWALNGHAIPAPLLAWNVIGSIADDTLADWPDALDSPPGSKDGKSAKKGSWTKEGVVSPPPQAPALPTQENFTTGFDTYPFGQVTKGQQVYKSLTAADPVYLLKPTLAGAPYIMWSTDTGHIAGEKDPNNPGWVKITWPAKTYENADGTPKDTMGNWVQVGGKMPAKAPKAAAAQKPVYTHPSGVVMDVPSGAKIYQHKKVPTSYLVVKTDGTAVKYDKNGKAIDGHQQLAVLDKNYTDVTGKPDAPKTPIKKAAVSKKAAYAAKKAPMPATHEDSGIPEIGWVDKGSSIYKSKVSENVWLVQNMQGDSFHYEYDPDSGSTHKSSVDLTYMSNDAFNAAWEKVTPGVPEGPALTFAQIADLPWDQAEKLLPSGSVVWQNTTTNNIFAYDIDLGTNKAKQYQWDAQGNPLPYDDSMDAVDWSSVSKFLTTQSESSAPTYKKLYVGVSTMLGIVEPADDSPEMSSPEKTGYFKSLPPGSEFIDNGPYMVAYVHPGGPGPHTYYTIKDDGSKAKDKTKAQFETMKGDATTPYPPDEWPKYYYKKPDGGWQSDPPDGVVISPEESEPSIIDFENGYTLHDGDVVYQLQPYGDYEVLSQSGNYIASFKEYDKATKTAKGKGLQSGPETQAGWAKYLVDENANSIVDTAKPEPMISNEAKSKVFYSLPAGSGFVDFGPGAGAYVWNMQDDTYYGLDVNGHVAPVTATNAEIGYKENKDKAASSNDYQYPKYFVAGTKPVVAKPEPSTFAKPEVAPKEFSAASVKVTSFNWMSSNGWVDGWTTVDHKDVNGHAYRIGKNPETGKWFVEEGGWQGGTELAVGFKSLKDAKYWVDSNATYKPPPAVVLTVDPNAPESTTVDLNGVSVYLPPGSEVWSVPVSSDETSYYVWAPYRSQVFTVNPQGQFISAGPWSVMDFVKSYPNAKKVAQTAVPEEYVPTLVEGVADDSGNPFGLSVSLINNLAWETSDSQTAIDITKAILLMQKYREEVKGSEKAKTTRSINAMRRLLALADYQQRVDNNEPISSSLAAYIRDMPDDVFKGTHFGWSVKQPAQAWAGNAKNKVRWQSLAESAKVLTGKEIPETFFKGGVTTKSGMSLAEIKQFLAKQGFEYSDGVDDSLAESLLRTYLSFSPTINAKNVNQAKKNVTYAKVIVEYKAWQDQQKKAKKPTKKAKAAAKMDWAAAQTKAAADAKALRDDFLKEWPGGVAKNAQSGLVEQVAWVNEHGSLGFTVPQAASPMTTWRSRIGILAAVTGSPLLASLGQSNEQDEAYSLDLPAWQAFASTVKDKTWFSLSASGDAASLKSGDWSEALKDIGIPGTLVDDNTQPVFLASMMVRAAKNAQKALATPGSVEVAAKAHALTKVEDNTVLPAHKPSWANDYAWSIVGLTLAGQKVDMLEGLNVDLGSAYVNLQNRAVPGGAVSPLYAWSEFPISNPLVQSLVKFSRDPYANDEVKTGVANVLVYLASKGYFESPLATEKTIDVGWAYTGHFVPGDKVYKTNSNEIIVVHQSGAAYRVTKPASYYSDTAPKVVPLDHDYWTSYIAGAKVVYEQPVLIDKDYAANYGINPETFDAYMSAKDAKTSTLDLPGMAGVSKGESLVFMKKYLSLSKDYKSLVDKIPSMSEGTLKYLHYSAKSGNTDAFDFAMLLDKHGQFDATSMPDLVTYEPPEGAPWATAMAQVGMSADDIYSQWASSIQVAAFQSVFGKDPENANFLNYDEAAGLSDVLTGKVKWTDPNPKGKAAKGTLVFTEIFDSAPLGGMHTKHKWADQYGNEWMSKAFASDPQAKARVDAEHYACEISRLYGYDAPESRIETLNGEYSYLQFLSPSPKDFVGTDWHDLPLSLTAKVMTEHILDWVISNHDTHEGNLLFTPGMDDFFGIDKGQAFKFFPNDQLAEGYLPPGNPVPVWYDHVYSAIRTKSISKEDADFIVDTVLRKAAYVSVRHDEDYRKYLVGAFQNRTKFPSPYETREKFIDGLMARKAHTFDDFEALYKGLYKTAGWDWSGKSKEEYLPKKIGPAHVAVTPDFAADVLASHSFGQSLFFAGPELEDGHLQFCTTNAPDKSVVLRAESKLRKEADKTFTAWLQQHTVVHKAGPAYQPTVDHTTLFGLSEQFQYLTNYVKTINAHAEDKKYNGSTIHDGETAMTGLQAQIDSVEATKADDPLKLGKAYGSAFTTAEQRDAWLAAAKVLVAQFKSAQEAHQQQIKTPFNKNDHPLTMPSYKVSPGLDTSGKPKIQAAYADDDGVTFYKWSDGNYVKMVDGKYVASDEGEFTEAANHGSEVDTGAEPESPETGAENVVSVANKVVSVKYQSATTYSGKYDYKANEFNQSSDSGGKGMTGMEYEIAYDNVKVKYMPWSGSDVAKAQEGLLRLEITNWDGTAPDIEAMLAVLRDTGLELKEADETDLEILYWRRLAGIVKDRSDRKEPKNKALLEAVSKIEGMSSKTEERDALRKAWEIFYGEDGVAKAVKDKSYLPFFATPRAKPDETPVHDVGKPLWNRPVSGVTYKDLYKWTNGKLPRHDVTYGGSQENMRKVMLSGALLSTEERTRVVGWISGGSSSGDQKKGSSAFNFFRQKQDYQYWDFIAEPHIYFRDSNYAFSWDAWGELDARAKESKFSIQETIDTGGTEILFKNWVSVMDDLAVAVISDSSMRNEVIQFYKSLGITEIRGLPIEERFVSDTYEAQKTVEKVWKMALDKEKEGVA